MIALSQTVRSFWMWIALVVVGAAALFEYPGGYISTSHAVLHGLCAQIPSHSFAFNGARLPFDARMTGIYSGLLITLVSIGFRQRLMYSGDVPRSVVAVLGCFVGAMGVDGFNSLFTDLGIGQLYRPNNVARLVTGYGAGMALSVALCWLVAASAWKLSTSDPGVTALADLIVPALGLPLCAGLILSGAGWLLLPMTMVLVLSAWLTMTMLMLVLVLILFKIDEQVRSFHGLHLPGAVAAVLGFGAMLLLAGGRFWLEHALGISDMLM